MAPRPQADDHGEGVAARRDQPTDLVARLAPEVKRFADGLPANYRIEVGGTVEESGKAEGPIAKVVPLMLFLMATFLMIQLQSVQKLFLVASVAPLGLIGVVAALLPTGTPMGFVAILGILALIGIIIRNSVILVTQIDAFEKDGKTPWEAVLEATHHRTRPILLTAAAASLGMIPIAREVFWGPMAYAMIGGIVAATLLTLIFLPALYVAWYRIRNRDAERGVRGRGAAVAESVRGKESGRRVGHPPRRRAGYARRCYGDGGQYRQPGARENPTNLRICFATEVIVDTLQGMRVFARVVDSGSFTSAAQALDLSTAQVSRLISDLRRTCRRACCTAPPGAWP